MTHHIYTHVGLWLLGLLCGFALAVLVLLFAALDSRMSP